MNQREKPTAEGKADFINRLDDAIQKAYSNLKRTQARYKKDYNKSVKRANRRIRAGDWVLLDNPEAQPSKLEDHSQGPFRVLTNDGHTFTIDRNGILERVSPDRIVASPPPDDVPNSNVKPRENHLPEGVTLSTEEYVVDNILDDTLDEEGHRWFLVEYCGYDESSFQPEAILPAELVTRYL